MECNTCDITVTLGRVNIFLINMLMCKEKFSRTHISQNIIKRSDTETFNSLPINLSSF